jgi:hypothetical protein
MSGSWWHCDKSVLITHVSIPCYNHVPWLLHGSLSDHLNVIAWNPTLGMEIQLSHTQGFAVADIWWEGVAERWGMLKTGEKKSNWAYVSTSIFHLAMAITYLATSLQNSSKNSEQSGVHRAPREECKGSPPSPPTDELSPIEQLLLPLRKAFLPKHKS